MENQKSLFLPFLVLAIAIAVGLLGAGYFIGSSRTSERFVEVKGFSEKILKSDSAIWQIPYRATGDILDDAVKSAESSQNKILQFLITNGFTKEELEINPIKVNDKSADAYNNNEPAKTNRYVVEGRVTLRTNKVDQVVAVTQKTVDLAKTGVIVSGDYGASAPQYDFTQLDKLKPEMIAEATKDARRAAAQFAKDSGTGVGAIRNAQQGYFSIDPVDQVSGSASVFKKVRVVSTVQFFVGQ